MKTSYRVAIALVSALVSALSSAPATLEITREADVAWVVSGGFCEPETVLALPDATLLVSNVCDFRVAGTGFLTRLDGDGSVIAWRAVDGLNAPLGMAMRDDELLVIDSNRIRHFSWPDLEPGTVRALDTQIANDIAVDDEGTIYVTDTARGEVFVLAPGAEPERLLGAGRFPGANGIAATGDVVYVGGERLWSVDLATGTVVALGPPSLADIDGIELEGTDTLQVTPVGGPLVRLRDGAILEVIGGEGVSSANHGYAPALGLALIPTGFDNTVIALRLALD